MSFKDVVLAVVNSPKVRAAFYALLGAVAVVVANSLGISIPGLGQ